MGGMTGCVTKQMFMQILLKILHHTTYSVIQILHGENSSINITTQSRENMQIVKQIDRQCAQKLPYYQDLSNFTQEKLQQSLACLDQLYLSSTNKLKHTSRVSKQFRNDLLWILSQAAEDILELLQTKFSVEPLSTKEHGKGKRLMRIYSTLKDKQILPTLQKLMDIDEIMAMGKQYHQQLMVPLFLRIRATVEVSREIMMEAFAERLNQLQMTYKCSKDSITMFCSGEFSEEKIVQQMKDKFGCLKQFTVSFVQKGMEIKISKEDLVENYHHIMEKLSEMARNGKEKSVEQWTSTKTKSIDLYKSVLRRIKEKEQMLVLKYEPSKVVELKREQQEKDSPSDTTEEKTPEEPEKQTENPAKPSEEEE